MKQFYLSLILVFVMLSASSQITITGNNTFLQGDDITFRRLSNVDVSFDVGVSGENVVWDFSGQTEDGTSELVEYIDHTGLPYADQMNTVELAARTNGSPDNYFYFNTNGGAVWERSGWYSDNGGTVMWVEYTNTSDVETPLELYQYPFTYNDNFSSTFKGLGEYDMGSGADDLQIELGNYGFDCDGWGTLVLPHKVYQNALRVHVTEAFTLQLMMVGTPVVSSVVEEDKYCWFVEGVNGPVMSYSATTHDGSPTYSSEWYRPDYASIEDVDFVADALTGNTDDIFTFTNLSEPLNQGSTFAWEFSPATVTYTGGTDATSAHPQVIFNEAGTYTAVLTLTNSNFTPTEGIEIKTDYIVVDAVPELVVDFTADIQNVPSGGTITFENLTVPDESGGTTYAWNLNPAAGWHWDGFTDGTSENPIITFENDGCYAVQLVATNTSFTNSPVTEVKATFFNVGGVGGCNVGIIITNQPVNTTACIGGNATFSITATGNNLTYQWKKDGNNISGATANTYTITGVVSGDVANYTCDVSDSYITVASNPASLSISAGQSIISHPSDANVCDGTNVTFTISATGSNLVYQWKQDGNTISGATNSSYTINGVTSANAGNYTCMLWGDCSGELESNAATLTVFDPTVIVTQPTGATLCEGEEFTLSLTATGIGVSYQWQVGGVDIAGATANSYTIPSIVSGDAGNYTCNVSGGCGNVTSDIATLNITSSASILSHPSNASVCEGNNVTFTVMATGTGLSYQWQLGGVDVSGATSSSYTINGVVSSQAGDYTCVVSGSCDDVNSNVASLTIFPSTSITQQPSGETLHEGDLFTVEVFATGIGLSYQWQKNGSDISGATSSSYSISSIVSGDAGDYTCNVIGGCGNASSDIATLVVNPTFNVTITPTNASCGADDGSAILSVSGGSGNYSILWSNGETTYSASELTSGMHSVQITDNVAFYTENHFFNINNSSAPSISFNTTDNSCYGDALGSVTAVIIDGTAPYLIEWSTGETADNITGLAAGSYSITVTDGNDCLSSSVAVISEPLQIDVSFDIVNSTCNNSDGELTANPTGGTGAYSYDWSNGGTTANITGLIAGSYSVIVEDANLCQAIF